MAKYVFRWIEDLKGSSYPVRALAEMPNNDSLRQIEEHELTEAQETLPLAELVKAFPQPTRVRVLH
jgi:hypothetical protein